MMCQVVIPECYELLRVIDSRRVIAPSSRGWEERGCLAALEAESSCLVALAAGEEEPENNLIFQL